MTQERTMVERFITTSEDISATLIDTLPVLGAAELTESVNAHNNSVTLFFKIPKDRIEYFQGVVDTIIYLAH